MCHDLQAPLRPRRVLTGFDGYLDSIKHVVAHRDAAGPAYFGSLTALGQRIEAAAGKSAQLELVPVAYKLGGNAPIMAQTLGCLGIDTVLVGTLGAPDLHPLFGEMHPRVQTYSLGAAAETLALEFGDGKLILSDVQAFADLGWARVAAQMGISRLDEILGQTDLIALVGLSNLPLATDLLDGLRRHLASGIARPAGQQFFFDLADPTRLADKHLRALLGVIGQYRELGRTTLGLNENEAIHLAKVLRGQTPPAGRDALPGWTTALYQALGVDALLVHPVDCSLLIDSSGCTLLEGRLVPQPRILTGGGDNLNAGFCLGLMQNWPTEACLLAGMATSGAYISLGHSPDRAQLTAYLRTWQADLAS
ncbi:MAG: hypothetical protein OHK0039_00750 [Bacteroidia bacterium]